MKKETGNKILLFSVIALFLISIISQSVLADVAIGNEEIKAGANVVGASVRGFFEGLLTPLYSGESPFATKFMLFVLLFLMIWTVMPNIIGEDHKLVNFLVTLVITSLAIMAIPQAFINAIVAQYGVMGATILSVIPFAIIFITSIRIQNLMIARVIWLFYTIYYFAFYIYLIFNQQGTGAWYWVTTETIPYVAAIIAGCIMFWFIVPIREMVFAGEMSALKEAGEQIADRGKLLHKLQKEELNKSYGMKK